jgi:hypothetical protein
MVTPKLRFPLQEKVNQRAGEISAANPQMSRGEVLERAGRDVEHETQKRFAAFQGRQGQARPRDGIAAVATVQDPSQSGIVKRAERMMADHLAAKATEAQAAKRYLGTASA